MSICYRSDFGSSKSLPYKYILYENNINFKSQTFEWVLWTKLVEMFLLLAVQVLSARIWFHGFLKKATQ